MFDFLKPNKKFFTSDEEHQIMTAIRTAERASSGEIRLFVESECKETIEKRTVQVFKRLKMYRTRERNGVLLYVAMESHKFAIFGDEGIHKKMGFSFWTAEAATMKSYFERGEIIEGLCKTIVDIGEALKTHFPHPPDDRNELPDKPVYGK
jgi:uncharacterized membrane protein